MSVTIQQIAEKAGVSRGTVDRALNNRGRINPEVAEMVKRTAEEMGYVHKARKETEKCRRKEKDRDRNTAFRIFLHAGSQKEEYRPEKRTGRTWRRSDRKKRILPFVKRTSCVQLTNW